MIKKAKIIAAQRETSISRRFAEEIEYLIGEGKAYERAERQAMAFLENGFHLGGIIQTGRDEWHGLTMGTKTRLSAVVSTPQRSS